MLPDTVTYRRYFGNVSDALAVGTGPIRSDRGGMFLCLRGEVEVTLDDSVYTLREHDLCIYFPSSVLEVRRRSDDLDGLLLSIDINAAQPVLVKVSDIDRLLDIRQHPVTHLSDTHVAHIRQYIALYLHHQSLAQQLAETNRRSHWQLNNLQCEEIRNCLLLQIIIAYMRDDTVASNGLNRQEEIVRRFFTALRQHGREEHEVGYYAAQQCLSMRHFSTVVRERTGRTPRQWIVSALLTDARQLLTEADRTVKEVSDLLHFPNQSYFGKWFRTNAGMSPMEFKQQK